jgi:hypothetical protein
VPKKAKSLLHTCVVERVKTKRTCGHFGTEMTAGELCLVIKEGYRKSSPYSAEAVRKMISQARQKLDTLEQQFEL